VNWNEYQQQALTTAFYPLTRELEYTVLGLGSEVGELGEAYAAGKQGWGYTQDQVANLLKEAGDCYWYLAAVADALNVPLQTIRDNYASGVTIGTSRGLTVLQIVARASHMQGVVKKAIRDNDGFLSEAGAEQIKSCIGASLILLGALVVFYGSTPEAVTAKNLNKLADRKQRGVLQGSGDNR
jgi:NTP pyrophosphatase (non-canonical NTP hydrolase)